MPLGGAGERITGVEVEGEAAVGDLDAAVGTLAVPHQGRIDSRAGDRVPQEGRPRLGTGLQAGGGAIGVEHEPVHRSPLPVHEMGPVRGELDCHLLEGGDRPPTGGGSPEGGGRGGVVAGGGDGGRVVVAAGGNRQQQRQEDEGGAAHKGRLSPPDR